VKTSSKSAYFVIVLFGIVSLMGDVVYEGSKGITPDFLKFLGASAVTVGFASGLGEFVGYALRLVSGILADSTQAYWLFIFLGYGLIGSIPALGFVTRWEIAVVLYLLERLGKALRTPSRDTILSVVSEEVGTGKAFGFHELMDQIGATVGPTAVATMMLFSGNNYSQTYSFLFLPFLVLLGSLLYAYKKVGERTIVAIEKSVAKHGRGRVLGKSFYMYTAAVVLSTVGLIPASLILYKSSAILQPQGMSWMVPLIYLLIQGIDAATAMISGLAYDKYGIKVLAIPFILAMLPSLLTLAATELAMLAVAAATFGVVLGMQESIYRAAVSKFTSASSRGTAYGIFNAALGIAFLISGGIYGFFLDYNVPLLMISPFTVLLQIVAVITLLRAASTLKAVEKR